VLMICNILEYPDINLRSEISISYYIDMYFPDILIELL